MSKTQARERIHGQKETTSATLLLISRETLFTVALLIHVIAQRPREHEQIKGFNQRKVLGGLKGGFQAYLVYFLKPVCIIKYLVSACVCVAEDYLLRGK